MNDVAPDSVREIVQWQPSHDSQMQLASHGVKKLRCDPIRFVRANKTILDPYAKHLCDVGRYAVLADAIKIVNQIRKVRTVCQDQAIEPDGVDTHHDVHVPLADVRQRCSDVNIPNLHIREASKYVFGPFIDQSAKQARLASEETVDRSLGGACPGGDQFNCRTCIAKFEKYSCSRLEDLPTPHLAARSTAGSSSIHEDTLVNVCTVTYSTTVVRDCR